MILEYELKNPIKVSGNEIRRIVLQEPTFDMVTELGLPADAGDPAKTMKLLEQYVVKCSGLPEEAVGSIKISDAMELVKLVTRFFTDSAA